MESLNRILKDIFDGNSRILEIPSFQRAYVWKEENWDRFLEDMMETSSLDGKYFFGSLILKKMNNAYEAHDRYYIVDGQQRITTLLIFLKFKCLLSASLELKKELDSYCLLKENQKIALKHNRSDKKEFEFIMNLESYTKEIPDFKLGSKLHEFYAYLVKNIQRVDKCDYHKIVNQIEFVETVLETDDDEQKIFDSINSQGVSLTAAELLKNHLFDVGQEELYEENWFRIFEKDEETKYYWDREILSGRTYKKNIDLFLHAYLQIKLNDKGIILSKINRVRFSRYDNIFQGYKILLKQISKEQLIKEINEYGKLYSQNLNHSVIEDGMENKITDRISGIIFSLENTFIIPYVLYILANVGETEKVKIFNYLEAYIIRRFIAKRNNSDNAFRVFPIEFITKKINSVVDLKSNLNNREASEDIDMPDDTELLSSFHRSNNKAKGILYFLENRMQHAEDKTGHLLPLDEYTLEHLMPRKWEQHWEALDTPEEKDERNKALTTLGNLAIIIKGLNSSIGNSSWAVKKKGKGGKDGLKHYAAGLATLRDALEKKEWDESAIKERADWLARKAIEFWKYS